ncbi:MAG: hypothetical protein ACREX3_09200 [Gammaproteobacteria bacterium]
MTTRLQTVEPQTPIEDLFGIYEQGRVPIVVEEQKFPRPHHAHRPFELSPPQDEIVED